MSISFIGHGVFTTRLFYYILTLKFFQRLLHKPFQKGHTVSVYRRENRILILPLKTPLRPQKTVRRGVFLVFSVHRKSLCFLSKQIIMKEIAIMTGSPIRFRKIRHGSDKENRKREKLWNEKQHGMSTRKKI